MVYSNDTTTFGNSLSLRVDGAIGAMSLSPNGRDAVLAGRKGLFIIDLDDPFTPPRWLHHITSWEVADVQWSPHHFVKPSWCISTSNQKGLLWDLSRPSNNAIANILHSHTRAISDINFHPFDPEILATCSIDTFIMSWDMRTPRKPVVKLAEWRAGAIQVKWNHENPFEIASSHDNSFYVWDTRKGALPVMKVDKAHEGKINGLDFNQGLKNIITCSNDGTVKFWNLKDGDGKQAVSDFSYFDLKPEKEHINPSVIIKTGFPIARARTLPFGTDKACGIMPLIGGKDSIHLANYDTAYSDYLTTGRTQTIKLDPVYTFKGHSGPMKDFLWRPRRKLYEGSDVKHKWEDFQLVTWASQEYDLKLWQLDEEMYKSVNYNPTFFNVFKEESDSDSTRPTTPSETDQPYSYETYCCEPRVTIDDLTKTNGGDLLSALTLLQIAERNKQSGHDFSQLNHLNWISGVRMGHAGRDNRKVSSSSTMEDDGPSNLGEEVSVVGHKFPKIRFEKISVSTGELVISLSGPVPKETNEEVEIDDEDSSLIFMRINIKFPKSYPYLEPMSNDNTLSSKQLFKIHKQNLIDFDIEETHELTKDIKNTLLDGLNKIAQFYTNKYNQFCLEPCLRYLLGDNVKLDDDLMMESRADTNDDEGEFIQEVGNEGWVDDLLNQQPGFNEILSSAAAENGYSSGDDDAEIGDLLQDESKTSISLEHNDKIVDSTPLPKGCGAVWTPTGQLICFFIPKNGEEDNTSQDFNAFTFGDNGANGDESIASDSDVEDSDSEKPRGALMKKFTSTSSDESLKNDWAELMKDEGGKKKQPGLFHLGLDSRFADHESSHKSSLNRFTSIDGASNNRSTSRSYRKNDSSKKNVNIVEILDYSHLLPDKRDLALEYKVVNDSPENLANHNSKVALRHGLKDVSDVWKLIEIIMMKSNNLSCRFFEDYFLPSINQKHSQDDQSTDGQDFYWNNHPFGSKWLIKKIFEFFEARQNVQMLAMMACVLYEDTSKYKAISQDKQRNKSIASSRKGTSFSFPFNHLPNNNSLQNHYPFSHSSYNPSSYNQQINQVSMSQHLLNHSTIPPAGLNSSFSSPPEINHRNSSISSFRPIVSPINYAPSINSSIESNSVHESPDKFSYLRKAMLGSPNQSLVNNSYSSLSETLGAPQDSPKLSLSKKTTSKFELRRPKKQITASSKVNMKPKEPVVTCELLNTQDLDLLETDFNKSLLSCISSEKLKLYREYYAEMLYNWNLPISRLEILEYNFQDLSPKNTSTNKHKCKLGLRKKLKQEPNQNFVNSVTPIFMKNPNSWNTKKGNTVKHCNLCSLITSKSFTLCAVCEHILHTDCASEWWADNIECPSGCGCKCLEYGF